MPFIVDVYTLAYHEPKSYVTCL